MLPNLPKYPPTIKSFLYWSGGKDAAMAYHIFCPTYGQPPQLLVCMLTTKQKVAAHEVKKEIIQAQANAIGIPILFIETPAFGSNQNYEEAVVPQLQQLKTQGYTHAICGDIFLADIKNYRTQLHAQVGIDCIFPLWDISTATLAPQIVESGIQPIIAAINKKYLTVDFLGNPYDTHLLKALPATTDPCGENGEFHTVVYDAPFFKHPLLLSLSQTETITYNAATPYQTTMAFIQVGLAKK